MKYGREKRKNGNEIYKITGKSGHTMYHVFKRDSKGDLVPSKNGPWDRLLNARSDSEGRYDE